MGGVIASYNIHGWCQGRTQFRQSLYVYTGEVKLVMHVYMYSYNSHNTLSYIPIIYIHDETAKVHVHSFFVVNIVVMLTRPVFSFFFFSFSVT